MSLRKKCNILQIFLILHSSVSHVTQAYIIEVRFEFGRAEDWQSVAERVGLAQDLVVKRYLACREPRRETGLSHAKKRRSVALKTSR